MIDKVWLAVGLVGQLLFAGRFILQWVASEKAHKSVVPLPFWYLSLAGSFVLLAYAIHRLDPVFILGQSAGSVIYVRNLWLIHDEKKAGEQIPDEVV